MSPQIQLEDVYQPTYKMQMCTLAHCDYTARISLLVETRKRDVSRLSDSICELGRLFRLADELEQPWESPLNKMMKLHNNDLTHKQPGSRIIFTQWPLCNSSVKTVPS